MSVRFFLDKIEIDNTNRFDCKGRLFFPFLKKELKFPYQIDGIVEFKSLYVIMIDSCGKGLYNENVFGVSKATGEILWQIEPVMRADADSPFTGLWKEGDKILLYNWSGYEYTVVPETGEILGQLFTK